MTVLWGILRAEAVRRIALGARDAATLIHRPQVFLLDRTPIGLDVTMQAAVRDFIRRSNERRVALESSARTRPLLSPPQLTAAAISMSARVAEIVRTVVRAPLEEPSSDSFARSDG